MGSHRETSQIIIMMPFIFLSFLFCLGAQALGALPEWKDLECEKGHKYLFSEIKHNWFEARGECELYGGWLVQINDLTEFNCLMRHGVAEETQTWYWTDGNDVENTGVWTHAYDNSDVTFFGQRINCCTADYCPHGGDALNVLVGGDKRSRGNFCDWDTSTVRNFICEAII